jgi:hypothetical protein
MVTPCSNDIQHFIVQTNAHNVKKSRVIKIYKIKESAPTCFGLQGNHHQGAAAISYLKLHTWFNADTQKFVQDVVSVMAAYYDL